MSVFFTVINKSKNLLLALFVLKLIVEYFIPEADNWFIVNLFNLGFSDLFLLRTLLFNIFFKLVFIDSLTKLISSFEIHTLKISLSLSLPFNFFSIIL